MRKRQSIIFAILTAIALAAMLFACAGPQPVRQYELGKVAAESILFEARVLQNQGKITAAQFDKVRAVYDRLKQTQDLAIDARKALIAYNTADNQNKAQAAMTAVLQLSTQMVGLATELGFMKGGQ